MRFVFVLEICWVVTCSSFLSPILAFLKVQYVVIFSVAKIDEGMSKEQWGKT
jgi:hypothetical protein